MKNYTFVLAIIFSGNIICSNQPPIISIITSIYKGKNFIENFMKDITQQTIFEKCELILISGNSPDKLYEEKIINQYIEKFPNMIYIYLRKDPGLYGVWNLGIALAKGKYIANANIDDRLAHHAYEVLLSTLEQNPEIDLVYADGIFTQDIDHTFYTCNRSHATNKPEFSKKAMQSCLPGNHPMWRKSLHNKYGYFDESFLIGGDWEFWLRVVEKDTQFKKVPQILGTFYLNPNGLSTSNRPEKGPEVKRIYSRYQYLWENDNPC